MRLRWDIETRSACDLRKCGVYVYAEDDSTEVTMLSWQLDKDPIRLWFPPTSTRPDTRGFESLVLPAAGMFANATLAERTGRIDGGEIPELLLFALLDPTVELEAHSAAFERTNLTGKPGRRILPPEAVEAIADLKRWDCSAARAAALGLPRTLEGACAASGVSAQKDRDGHKLMMRMCKPKPKTGKKGVPPVWHDELADLLREGVYCMADVAAEHAFGDFAPPLSEFEREVWMLTERANDRGVRVDADLLLRISLLCEEAEAALNKTLAVVTDGAVKKVTNHGALTQWLKNFDIDDDLGEDGVGKAALAGMLERTDLDPLIHTVLVMRQEGGKSSSAKYRSILDRLSSDGRIRGVLVYCGAASTGRWSSRGAQLHNLPRPTLLKKASKALTLIRDIKDGCTLEEAEEFYGPIIPLAAELLRPVFTASDGTHMARGDSKQIEARVLPWLAGAEWKLDAFRRFDAGTGPDLYKIGASGIYKITPEEIDDNDPRRQVGKVSELALGFQGATNALQAMSKGYGVKIPHWETPKGAKYGEVKAPDGTDQWIVDMWRAANLECSGYGYGEQPIGLWKLIQDAAIRCMETTAGEFIAVGDKGLGFKRNRRAMVMKLPSGRPLFYWSPKLKNITTSWGKQKLTVVYRGEDSQTKVWGEHNGYGGLWTENAVQAYARDLMAFWLLGIARAGMLPVLSVHDEGIAEAQIARWATSDEAGAAVEAIMKTLPPHAAGLPVNADSSAGPRYLKV